MSNYLASMLICYIYLCYVKNICIYIDFLFLISCFSAMPRPPLNRDTLIMWHSFRRHKMKFLIILYFCMLMMKSLLRRRIRMNLKEPSWYDPTIRLKHLNDMIARNDILCIEQLRMDRRCFRVLCSLVREYGGLQDTNLRKWLKYFYI